ncbi:hypothetical protein [Croceimicrobium hydrocarbonivorans]|uniref:Uncharacterized protein n=1 Tax=Croceimicrobium hydrocarbonivorans TaxID=2761580 RepID=A0A7H0VIP9_9FLAO|nr:hypothetical protein [Croceimicrobium hydrocarbonivorans]QNR25597.1 hypothetical protein H4K34_07070 [Croceimicrobium hydrocarbonivorans]
MEKDKTILDLLERLKSSLDLTALKVVDHWPSDLCAIGLQKENRLIYISTFNFANREKPGYDYDLELINRLDETNIYILKKGREASEDELINEIKAFFEL